MKQKIFIFIYFICFNAFAQNTNTIVSSFPSAKENFNNVKLRMREADVLKLNILIQEDNNITKKEEISNKIVQLEYQKNIKPIVDIVNATISKYARVKKREAVCILEQMKPALQYINPEKMITKEMIKVIFK